jgi:hypothetical protein
MKRAIAFSIIILALFSCSVNKEEKAHKLIKEHLKSTLNDFSYYEPIEFSKLDSTFLEYQDSPEGKNLTAEIHKAELDLMNIYKPINDCKNNLIHLQKKYRIEKALYKPEYSGWQMMHLFTCVDTLGTKMTKLKLFKFDTELTEVYSALDIEDMHKTDLSSFTQFTSKNQK